MGLPIQKAPKFRCKISDGQEVTYRPFLVKEQKYLLIARESSNPLEIIDAVKNLINEVTENKIDVDKLPMHDLEYLFLQVRAKSVGESVQVPVFCNEEACDGRDFKTVDLTAVEIRETEEEIDSEIHLSDTLGVTLRQPKARQLAQADHDGKDENDKLIKLLMYGLETVFDDETVYPADEVSDKDLKEFVESLTIAQVEKINQFFANAPYLGKDIEWQCNVCNKEQSVELRGLQNFF